MFWHVGQINHIVEKSVDGFYFSTIHNVDPFRVMIYRSICSGILKIGIMYFLTLDYFIWGCRWGLGVVRTDLMTLFGTVCVCVFLQLTKISISPVSFSICLSALHILYDFTFSRLFHHYHHQPPYPISLSPSSYESYKTYHPSPPPFH
jgi:hypothetical protein